MLYFSVILCDWNAGLAAGEQAKERLYLSRSYKVCGICIVELCLLF